MANVKFSQLPQITSLSANTIIPVVDSGVNYITTFGNLQSTVVAAGYSNANVFAYLPTDPTIIAIEAAQASTDANVLNLNLATNASFTSTNSNVTALSSALANTNINVASLTGNVYNNANVAAYLPTYTGNITGSNMSLSGTTQVAGNVYAFNFVGCGPYLDRINAANIIGSIRNATHANVADVANSIAGSNVVGIVGSATTAINVTANAQPNITSVGNLTTLTVTGNVTAGNAIANYYYGCASHMTGLTTIGNTQISNYLAHGNDPTIVNLQTEITSLTGNVYGNANVTALLSSGNIVTPIVTVSFISAVGNVIGNSVIGNVITGITVSATGNITSGNVITSGYVSAAGQVIGSGFTAPPGFFNLPRYTTAQIAALSGMVGGELVYNTSLNLIQGYQMNPTTSSMGWTSWTVAVYQ